MRFFILTLVLFFCFSLTFAQKKNKRTTQKKQEQTELPQEIDTAIYDKVMRAPLDLNKLITYARPSIKIPETVFNDLIYAIANMEFQKDNTELTSRSEIFLYDFLHLLRENEDYRVKISAYVNLGHKADNAEISKRRLAAFIKFLTEGGIAKNRIKGLYFGDKMPVIDLPLTRFEIEFDK